jgi:hypothetical protein
MQRMHMLPHLGEERQHGPQRGVAGGHEHGGHGHHQQALVVAQPPLQLYSRPPRRAAGAHHPGAALQRRGNPGGLRMAAPQLLSI